MIDSVEVYSFKHLHELDFQSRSQLDDKVKTSAPHLHTHFSIILDEN